MTAIGATAAARIPFTKTVISAEAREAAARVLASGWITTGPEVLAFEGEFAAWVKCPHAVAVSSCTAAIEIALRALRLPKGARVLTSTLTFCGAVHAIVHAGLEPVLVDIEPWTLMPDATSIEAAVRRAGRADAMVVLHFGGHPAPLRELAEAARLPLGCVIEDAAHAIGTMVDDQDVGAISAATCFSFYATKNLPIGEGGMITTANEGLAEHCRQARLHGMSTDAWKRYLPGSRWRYAVSVDGIKANMTDVQAAIGRAQLEHMPAWQARRAELARRYDARLSAIPGLRTPAWPASGRHGWHLYVLQVMPNFGVDRDSLIVRLAERGIDCSVHFIPVHHQPYFRELLGSATGACCPEADAAFRRVVSLPLYPSLSDQDVDRVCDEIESMTGSR